MPKYSGFMASWIWKKQDSYNPYQQVVIAQKFFRLKSVEQAEIRITTDGWYRLMINSEWVNDGPCRSWPEHFQYDRFAVTPYLVEGNNEIQVIAWHWSAGNFHTIPRQAGLLAQLDIALVNGRKKHIGTDASWMVAEASAWKTNTPKVSIQMEPQEYYDAHLENLVFEKAEVLFPAGAGPWQDLHPRDVALLTRKSMPLKSFVAANLVRPDNNFDFCVPTSRLANPGLIEANRSVGNAGGMASFLELDQDAIVRIQGEGFNISVDGDINEKQMYSLTAGKHFVLALSSSLFGHHNKERSLCLIDPPEGLQLVNPVDGGYENPWCWIQMPDFVFQDTDMVWPSNQGLDSERERIEKRYEKEIEQLLQTVKNEAGFLHELSGQASCLATNEMFVVDPHKAFLKREVIGNAAGWVVNPAGLMHDHALQTEINPAPIGDIELVYDLGEQSVGYYEFELTAEAGVEVDIFGVEYINPQGTIQHTWGNRNGMRYITREGRNRFISLKRRSQRYLFITFRKQTKPVHIRTIQLIESTYPINQVGSFDCSDSRLTRIYEISARTLKLCMEDTFTDCPLYEQTLWVGDARNEALYNFSIFGAEDIVQRCIRLAAQSLERYPIVGCQVPSCWDCLLPAWSFLWGISVWDYYQYSGNLSFLKEMWPAVLHNLEGAEGLLDDKGLFSGQFWNLFDWSGIDDQHATVLHNSMLLIGAIDAAQKMGTVLNTGKENTWLTDFRNRLKASLNSQWDPIRKAYPDSLHQDGTVSSSVSIHTNFLAVLYDVIEEKNYSHALNNILHPSNDMVKVGSPFAVQYLYETLDQVGKADEILKSIYDNYLPMLEEGATTVWEVFPTSDDKPADFPTRSHCHAWSSAPLHFLPRIPLGIRQKEAGGLVYEISPRPNGLSWAKGAVASPRGPVRVEWKLANNKLRIRSQVPEGVKLHFVTNDALMGLEIERDF